ncbi:MAG: class I SAM-dependent methyltransferase [Firmicutes bacterium]|nr:class I SAM-dependent methyltransferase [Bacillota bacterium]
MKYEDKFNLNYLEEISKKPKVFSYSDRRGFWDDEYISKNMLEAHLNPYLEAASRKYDTIKESCKWIVESLELKKGDKLIDLGCGPGLYLNELYKYGLNLTGIDYSKRSIEYAKEYSIENNLDIKYLYKDYLTLDYNEKFDVATLIYYDFGCFKESDVKKLLKIINSLLKKDGYFVFDVQTPYYNDLKEERSNWEICNGGFFSPNKYLELQNKYYYPKYETRLNQHIIIEENGDIKEYRLWHKHYTLEKIRKLLNKSNFKIKKVYSNLLGSKYNETSKELGIIAQKK